MHIQHTSVRNTLNGAQCLFHIRVFNSRYQQGSRQMSGQHQDVLPLCKGQWSLGWIVLATLSDIRLRDDDLGILTRICRPPIDVHFRIGLNVWFDNPTKFTHLPILR